MGPNENLGLINKSDDEFGQPLKLPLKFPLFIQWNMSENFHFLTFLEYNTKNLITPRIIFIIFGDFLIFYQIFLEILQLRAKFQTEMVPCSRFISITNSSDHRRV